MKIPKLFYTCLLFVAASGATTTLSAFPALDSFFKQADSPLPVAAVQGNAHLKCLTPDKG